MRGEDTVVIRGTVMEEQSHNYIMVWRTLQLEDSIRLLGNLVSQIRRH